MSRTIRIAGFILLCVAAAAIVGPWFSPHDYLTTDFGGPLLPPSAADARYFGTDDLGRDLFVRTMTGVRVTLVVALVASLVSLVIGVAYGATAGFVGGRVDSAMMRFVDIAMSIPYMFVLILLLVVFGRSIGMSPWYFRTIHSTRT